MSQKANSESIVGGEGRENRGPRGDRGDYRRKEGASGDFKPEFRGGLGKISILNNELLI
jgi:hypothetical protein